MPDYRSFFDRNWLAAFELGGADVTLTIARVEGVTVQSAGGSAERKIGIHFAETPKGMVSNTTNSQTIASLYGTDVGAWVGKKITIFPTITQFGREMKDCIRVRPLIPTGPASAAPIQNLGTPHQGPAFGGFGPPQGYPAPSPPSGTANHPNVASFLPQHQGYAGPPPVGPSGYGPPPAPPAAPVPHTMPMTPAAKAKKGARRAR